MILALHTGTPTCQMSTYGDGRWQDNDWEAGRTLAHLLLGQIQEAVGDVHGIEGIVVYEGPGSYTGLRIGLTVVNTLADSLHIPIVGVSGDNWRDDGLRRLHDGESDGIVMPVYGGDPHITTPRK